MMWKRVRAFDAYRVAGCLGLFTLIAMAFALRHAVGVTLDEPTHMRYARRVLAWYVTGFADKRTLVQGDTMTQYGGLFDLTAQIFVHFTHAAVATRHVASMLWAVAGIAATWKIAARLGGPRAGLLSACLLTATPCWFGHGLFNPKDIPFAAASAWALYGVLRFAIDAELPSLALSVGTGASIGAALGVRAGGLFLLAYPALALLSRWLWLHGLRLRPAAISSDELWTAAARLVTCWLVAWVCMVVAWPWAQVSPLVRPLIGAWAAAHSAWGGSMLWNGTYVDSQHLPRAYLPIWFAVTLPETYLLALGAGLACVLARPRLRVCRKTLHALVWLGFAAVVPVAIASMTRAVVYDAQRHFLFVLPPLAAVAGLALSRFLGDVRMAVPACAAAFGMLLALFGLVANDMIQLHPYEYVYFNRISGGLPAAHARFETDYWGASYTEALSWLGEQLNADDAGPARVATCNNDEAVKVFMREQPGLARHLTLAAKNTSADVYLSSTRTGCPNVRGRVVHVVERMGVPFLYVLQRRPLSAASLARVGASDEKPGG
jgi:Dolichyl-phosphate-mannose-protein mannosyltransferase